ncbi:hypothetical protein D3C81_1173980 [compost metagenome]
MPAMRAFHRKATLPCSALRREQSVDLVVRLAIAAWADPRQLVRTVARRGRAVELALDRAARNALRASEYVGAIAPVAIRVRGSGRFRAKALQGGDGMRAAPDLAGLRVDQRGPAGHHRLERGTALREEVRHVDAADEVLVLEPEHMPGQGLQCIHAGPDFRHAGTGEKREGLAEQECIGHVLSPEYPARGRYGTACDGFTP